MAEEYDHHAPDDDRDPWTAWIHPRHEPFVFRMSCCDCGLVHGVEFGVVVPAEGEPYGGEPCVRFRVRRLERHTGQLRRQMARRGDGVFDRLSAVGRRLGGQIMGAWNADRTGT